MTKKAKAKSSKKPAAKAKPATTPATCDWDGCKAPAQNGQFYCGNHLAQVMGVGGGAGHTHGR